jgi:hypothetical protein
MWEVLTLIAAAQFIGRDIFVCRITFYPDRISEDNSNIYMQQKITVSENIPCVCALRPYSGSSHQQRENS